MTNASLNEKQGSFYAPTPQSALPPPAYVSSPAPSALATASALYEYHPSDAGDLAILPNDRVLITEFMNADWAKGRNERTGMEGIFPRSYVAIVDEKGALGRFQPPPPPMQSSYGNMPVDVSQTGSSSAPGKESKLNANGKKFGKKMGNAGEVSPLIIMTTQFANVTQLFLVLVLRSDRTLSMGSSKERKKLLGFYGAGMAFGRVMLDIGDHPIDHAL